MFKINNLKTEKIGKVLWRLVAPLTFGTSKTLITIPKGFVTDGASTPNFLYGVCAPMAGNQAVAAVLHDYLYSKDSNEFHSVSRKTADDLFYAAMRSEGVSWLKAKTIYLSVRAGGASSYKKCYSREKV